MEVCAKKRGMPNAPLFLFSLYNGNYSSARIVISAPEA